MISHEGIKRAATAAKDLYDSLVEDQQFSKVQALELTIAAMPALVDKACS